MSPEHLAIVRTSVMLHGQTHVGEAVVDLSECREFNPLPEGREIFAPEMRMAIEQTERRASLATMLAIDIAFMILAKIEKADTVNGYTAEENKGWPQPRLRAFPSQCKVGDYVPESAIRMNGHIAEVALNPPSPQYGTEEFDPSKAVPIARFLRTMKTGISVWERVS